MTKFGPLDNSSVNERELKIIDYWNKIDLLHPFMKKTDELFFKAIKGFRHSSAGEKF